MAAAVYDRLMLGGRGDPFDRHVFACAVTIALGDAGRPLTAALGLAPSALRDVCAAYFASADWLLRLLASDTGSGADAVEEPDLRQLLLEHRSHSRPEEAWLAAIIARRSLCPNHLWQDMGLFARVELSRLLHRHFRPLARANVNDMKWKKFFYRALCARDGVLLCKAPTCDACCDVEHCFGAEVGEPLSGLQPALSALSQSRRTD